MKPLIVLALALSLTACKLPVGPTTQADLAKTEFVAESAYSAAGSAYMAVEASLPPDVKGRAKALLLSVLDCPTQTTCTGYLVAARQALAASNADTLAQQVSAITAAAAQVQQLIKH